MPSAVVDVTGRGSSHALLALPASTDRVADGAADRRPLRLTRRSPDARDGGRQEHGRPDVRSRMGGRVEPLPMPDQNGEILKAIERLEHAAEALEEAINAHANEAMREKFQKHLPKLREVIEDLNDQVESD
jgi:hypothetical protein